MILNIAIVVLTFLAMEGMAWLTHKFVMHGFMWYFHEDHHQPTPGFFEKNNTKRITTQAQLTHTINERSKINVKNS
jgi:hypothetical protein